MNIIQKFIIILSIVLAIASFLQLSFVQETILDFLNQNIPWSIPAFNYIKIQVLSGSLIGLFLYLMFTNIPLLPGLPAEAFVIFSYLKGTGIVGIVFIAAIVYAFFAAVYYFVGRFFGKKILEKMLRIKLKYSPTLDRFSGTLLFFIYLLPIPLPIPIGTVLVMLFGFYRTKFSRIIAAVGFSTAIRFLLMILLYKYTPINSYFEPVEQLLKIG